jgi:trimethylguanosine synthase
VLDAFCGVGGNAIAFAQTCQRGASFKFYSSAFLIFTYDLVIALDTSPIRLTLARHNAQIYGVADRIEFILSDYTSFAKSYLSLPSDPLDTTKRKIDVVFLSPPWGGPSYLEGTADATPPENDSHPSYSLSSIQPIHGTALFQLSRRITQNIAYYLPRNTNLEEISDLLSSEESEPPSISFQGVDSRLDTTVNENSMKEPEMVEVEEEWMGTKLKALTCYFGGLADGQDHLFDG